MPGQVPEATGRAPYSDNIIIHALYAKNEADKNMENDIESEDMQVVCTKIIAITRLELNSRKLEVQSYPIIPAHAISSNSKP